MEAVLHLKRMADHQLHAKRHLENAEISLDSIRYHASQIQDAETAQTAESIRQQVEKVRKEYMALREAGAL